MGLYTLIPPLFVYALLGTSRLLVVGPDTATGLISALGVGAVAAQGTAEFNALTSTLAILIGVFFLLFGAMRMGWVAAFIPTPVMRGFIEGLVCVTIIGQVPHLLGISGTSGNFFTKLWYVLNHLSEAGLAPVLMGLLSLALMLLLRRFAPSVPAALVVLVVATIAVSLLGGEARGVDVVGSLPSGLPRFTVPKFDLTTLQELAPAALAIALVGYAEALGAAKAAAMACERGSSASARTRMIHRCCRWFDDGARMDGGGDDRDQHLRELFARSGWEFVIATIVIAGELTLGVLQGIALGVALALLLLIYRTSHPHSGVSASCQELRPTETSIGIPTR
jgi:MFS superfamily sulfate permease-like transporter